MNKLIALAAVLLLGLQPALAQQGSIEPEFDKPYISVYGTDTCWYTQRMITDLKKANIAFNYNNLEDTATASKLHGKMYAAGISTKRYNLPVVDVSGTLTVRPESAEVIRQFEQ